MRIASKTNLHTNIIIIDPHLKIIERFDPEGHKPDTYFDLDNILEKMFKNHSMTKKSKAL